MRDLSSTVDLMLSDDYKDRFRAEYYQTAIRYDKLMDILSKFDRGELGFTPTCSRDILSGQAMAMLQYLRVLDKRAEAEGIDIPD